MMNSQNPAEKNDKTPRTTQSGLTPKAAEPPDVSRELTDEEIAAVAGGATAKTPHLPTP